MKSDMVRHKNETEEFLLSNTKNCVSYQTKGNFFV